jgi:hydroxymethylbilane synthase
LDGDALRLHTFVGLPDGSSWIRDTLEGPAGDPAALGREVGERLMAAGAEELLMSLRSAT